MVVATLTAILAATPQPAQAARGVERHFVQLVNDTRSLATLSPLRMSDRLSEVARRHSRRMASEGELYHSNLDRLLGPATTSVGENVGYGSSMDELLTAFMASPPHAENILGSYRRTGVGVIRADGRYWITQIFAA
jgi:uncharacterized protein YkwD